MQNSQGRGGNRKASEKAGAFLCFYNFAKLQFSEIQGRLYGVLQGCTPMPEASETIGLSVFLWRRMKLICCVSVMKRTEDYYRGLLLLKQDWNAEKNEAAIAMIKIRLNMIDKLQEKTRYDGQSDYYKNLQ